MTAYYEPFRSVAILNDISSSVQFSCDEVVQVHLSKTSYRKHHANDRGHFPFHSHWHGLSWFSGTGVFLERRTLRDVVKQCPDVGKGERLFFGRKWGTTGAVLTSNNSWRDNWNSCCNAGRVCVRPLKRTSDQSNLRCLTRSCERTSPKRTPVPH